MPAKVGSPAYSRLSRLIERETAVIFGLENDISIELQEASFHCQRNSTIYRGATGLCRLSAYGDFRSAIDDQLWIVQPAMGQELTVRSRRDC
jgi:hypothetical protein